MSSLRSINQAGEVSTHFVQSKKLSDIEEARTEETRTEDDLTLDNSTGKSRVTVRVRFEKEPEERQTALCFGSCCDVRKACLIVDTIYVLFSIWGVVRYSQGSAYLNLMVEQAQNVYSIDVYSIAAIVQLSLGILFALVGLVGSYTFQSIPVLWAAIWYIIDTIMYVVFFNWPAAIIIALYSYPHVALFVALRKGTLTSENYEQTEQHCCCGSGCSRDDDDDDE